jgi:hemerythrin
MAILWTNDLATGSERIDIQHKAIFERINTLLEACREGRGKKEVQGVLAFLEDYVLTHFSAEEQYMKLRGYSGYEAHKEQHEDFIRKLSEIKESIQASGPGVHTVISINQLLVAWFVNHIRKLDTQLGALLQERT